jgi:hypothetical protein
MEPQADAVTQAASGVAELTVERPLAIDLAALCRLLTHPIWLGVPSGSPPDRPDLQRVETDLAFPLHGQASRLTFRKAAYVDLGVEKMAVGCSGEIAWRAVSLAPLFPVFSGRLEVTPTGVRLSGFYAPPGGGVGLLVDRVFLHFVARRTAEWFLDRLTVAAADR